jgi:hypothetical protein
MKLDEKGRLEEGYAKEVSDMKEKNKDLEGKLSDARSTMDKYLRDYDALYKKTQKVDSL